MLLTLATTPRLATEFARLLGSQLDQIQDCDETVARTTVFFLALTDTDGELVLAFDVAEFHDVHDGAEKVAKRHSYELRCEALSSVDVPLGTSLQMAVFES